MARRKRTDGAAGAEEIFKGAAAGPMQPPMGIDLGEGVQPYWDYVVSSKAARAWNEQDLIMVVELARNLFRTEKLSFDMLTEDEVIGEKANPKSAIIDQLVKRARIIMIYLQVHPEATQGKARAQVQQNQDHSSAMNVAAQSDEDDLLASPDTH